MAYEIPYFVALAFSSTLAILVAQWLWSENLGLEGKVFVAFMLLHPLIAVFVALELVVEGRALSVVFFTIHNVLVVPILPLFFAFAALYTGRDRLVSRPVTAAIWGWAFLMIALIVTNPVHHLLWTEYETVSTPFTYLEAVPTGLYSTLAIPQPLLNFAAMAMLGHRFLFDSGSTRAQSVTLLVGFIPPWIVIGAWGAGILPGPLNGGFVVGSAWSFVLVALAIYRYQLFDIVPLARETVFEELDDPVIVVGKDDRFLDANRAALAAFPQFAGADGSPMAELLPQLLDEKGVTFADHFTYYDAETPREYAVSASSLATGGEVRGHALVVRDVTDRRAHVRDLEQQTAQLERFASTLSHDLRNPLNVAQGWLDVAIDTGEAEKLPAAREALDRMQRIIEDMLTLTREGRTIEDPERVSLEGVIGDAWETTRTENATLNDALDGTVEVYADRSRLQSLLENIFRNAIDHVGADVTVSVRRHDDGFSIEDDGPGIPPENRDRVFDYEFTTDPDGTGLGLAIVEAIAQAHGWDVTATEGAAGGAKIVFSDVDMVEGHRNPDSDHPPD